MECMKKNSSLHLILLSPHPHFSIVYWTVIITLEPQPFTRIYAGLAEKSVEGKVSGTRRGREEKKRKFSWRTNSGSEEDLS